MECCPSECLQFIQGDLESGQVYITQGLIWNNEHTCNVKDDGIP